MKKILITILLCLTLPKIGSAQQQLISTQYIYNRLLINPGYTGLDGVLTMSVFARNQWAGLEGAPNTQAFTLHTPLNTEKSASVGGIFIRDEVGVSVQNMAFFTGAYKLQVSKKAYVSVGLQGGVINDKVNFSELPGFFQDPTFTEGDINEVSPIFGAGLYLFTENFRLGLSSPNFIRRQIDQADVDSNDKRDRVYYFDLGYQFRLSPELTLDTNTLWRVLIGDPTQFDVYSVLGIREKVWVGASLRSFESVNALFRAKIHPNLFLGYSYDFTTLTELNSVSSGSHEFMLQFKLNKK
jgi:type IX secretion system PorP/SprF family membrane protein